MTQPSRILIVEDESIIAFELARTLERMGLAVLGTASSGEEAIKMADRSEPDLVLMDVVLKGEMDGIQAAQRITQRVGSAIIYLTAHADRELLERARITGPYAYLVKPVTSRDLRFAVEMAVYRQTMERKLRESEERLRLLHEDAPLSSISTDGDGRLVMVNKACLDLLGYRAHEVLGKSLYDFLPKESPGRLRGKLKKSVGGDEIFRTHLEMIRSDGASITVELLGRSARDERREFGGIHAVLHDVTDKQRAEEALKRSEARFRAIFEDSQDLLLVIDPDNGSIVRANAALPRLLGYEIPAVIGKNVSLVYPGVSELSNQASLPGAADIQDVLQGQTVIRADGSAVSMDLTTTVIPWDDAVAILACFRNVNRPIPAAEYGDKPCDSIEMLVRERTSELVQANEALLAEIAEHGRTEVCLRDSEQRFRAVIDSAADGIFMKDTARRYTFINPALADIFDLPVEQIVGKRDEDLFETDIAAHLRDVDCRVLKGERVEEEHSRPIEGTPLTFLDTRVPLVIRDEIVGICGVSRNITDRKHQQYGPAIVDWEYPSESMRSTMAAALLAARSESTVLITGESGTGKGHLARYIHDRSPRSGGPFFAINCAAVSSNLAESELFGHEAGAFTGAARRKRGLLELAEGGTLLLDEIGDLSEAVQAKLLTFLDSRTLTRVGGEASIMVDARLIVATNRNLWKEVTEKRFRQDLFHRLDVFSIRIPPLRERTEDLPVLIEQVLKQIATELQLPSHPRIDEDTIRNMRRYSWPGNVRELKNVLERAAILSRGADLNSDALKLDHSIEGQGPLMFSVQSGQPLEQAVRDFKRYLVNQALRRTKGNKTAAARLLGISRHTILNYLKQRENPVDF